MNDLLMGAQVPMNLAVLGTQVAVLGASVYWFRQSFNTYKDGVDEELRELRAEIKANHYETHEIKQKLTEMYTDIKWIKEKLQNK